MSYTGAQDAAIRQAMDRAGISSSRARGEWRDQEERAAYDLRQYRLDHSVYHVVTMTKCSSDCRFVEEDSE